MTRALTDNFISREIAYLDLESKPDSRCPYGYPGEAEALFSGAVWREIAYLDPEHEVRSDAFGALRNAEYDAGQRANGEHREVKDQYYDSATSWAVIVFGVVTVFLLLLNLGIRG